MALTDSIISYWKFDGDSTDSVGSNYGTDSVSIFTDNFDSYTDGDLNGQGSWSGETEFDVQGSVVQSGSKAVSCGNTSTKWIDKVGRQQTAGTASCYMRRNTNSSGYAVFSVREDTTSAMYIIFRADGYVRCYYNGGYTSQAYSADTWYNVQAQWRSTPSHQIRYRIDDGDWSDWYSPWNDWTTGPDRLRLLVDEHTSATSYWDNISVSDDGTYTDIIYNGLFSDDFESYTNGDLNGQGYWSGDTTFDIQSSVYKTGSKAVQNTDNTGGWKVITGTSDSKTNGEVRVFCKRTTTGSYSGIRLMYGATLVASLYFYNDGYLKYYDTGLGSWTQIQAYSADTWYELKIQWRNSDGYIRYQIDNNGWTSWNNPVNAWSYVDGLELRHFSDDSATSYFDDITVADNGVINDGALFNGSTSKIDFGDTFDFSSSFSISLWVRTQLTARQYLFNKTDASLVDCQWAIYEDTDGSVNFALFNSGGFTTYMAVNNTAKIDDGDLHHLVAIYDHSTPRVTLYIDNVSATSTSTSGSWNTNGAASAVMGIRGDGNNALTGLLDETGVWSRILTSTEVGKLYSSGNGLQYPFPLSDTGNFFQLF